MPTAEVLSPAKVNLTFDIKGLMPDGYHQVETLLQAIDLHDTLKVGIKAAEETTVSIDCTNEIKPKMFPTDESNLISKATRLFSRQLGKQFHADVQIEKHIPIGAGLAGGSSNGAAMIVVLNELFEHPFSDAELESMGAQLGADVPFCISGGTQIGTGRGDKLQPCKSDTTLYFCIVKPRKMSVATPWAYSQYDAYEGTSPALDMNAACSALQRGDLERSIQAFGNVFEPVIFQQLPELAQMKQELLDLGCWACHLSGSGPALFAVVADREHAHFIRRKFLKNEDDGFEYGSAAGTAEFGPPIEFHIAQSIPHGAQVLTYAAKSHRQ